MPVSTSEYPPALWAACIAPLSDPRLYEAARAAVSPARQQKADRLRFPEDRQRSVAAELLLRYAVREAGMDGFPAEFVFGPHGKPAFPDAPLQFSLSHSGQWVVCAAARCAVGCDVQQMLPDRLRLAPRYFSAAESADVAAQPTQKAALRQFYRYWTLKESFLKATGLGLSLPLNAFELRLREPPAVLQQVDDRDYRFREYGDLPGYCCALCAVGETPVARLQIVPPEHLFPSPENGGK